VSTDAQLRSAHRIKHALMRALDGEDVWAALPSLSFMLRKVASVAFPDPIERDAQTISVFLKDHPPADWDRILSSARGLASNSPLQGPITGDVPS
jgi:hypothetical protein